MSDQTPDVLDAAAWWHEPDPTAGDMTPYSVDWDSHKDAWLDGYETAVRNLTAGRVERSEPEPSAVPEAGSDTPEPSADSGRDPYWWLWPRPFSEASAGDTQEQPR